MEQSLWAAVPAFLRKLSLALKKHTGRELPINATPLTFGSWMGGDRDGNPNVTAPASLPVICCSSPCRQENLGGSAEEAESVLCITQACTMPSAVYVSQHSAQRKRMPGV